MLELYGVTENNLWQGSRIQVKINKIDCANIEIPLQFGKHFKCVIVNYDSSGKKQDKLWYDENEKIDTKEFISNFIIDNFDKLSIKIEKMKVSTKDSGKLSFAKKNNFGEPIIDDNLMIGYRKERKEIRTFSDLMICVLIVVLVIIIFFFEFTQNLKRSRTVPSALPIYKLFTSLISISGFSVNSKRSLQTIFVLILFLIPLLCLLFLFCYYFFYKNRYKIFE